MARRAVEDNHRTSLRIRPEEKKVLMRAAALRNTDLSDFMRKHSLDAAEAIIQAEERMKLSARDSLRVLEFLEHPPAPNAKLLAAAKALSKRR